MDDRSVIGRSSWGALLRQCRDRPPRSLDEVAVAQAERGVNLLAAVVVILGIVAACALVVAVTKLLG